MKTWSTFFRNGQFQGLSGHVSQSNVSSNVFSLVSGSWPFWVLLDITALSASLSPLFVFGGSLSPMVSIVTIEDGEN